MTFEKRVFSRFWLNFFFIIKKKFFFFFCFYSIWDKLNLFGTNSKSNSAIGHNWKSTYMTMGSKKKWGLFPKTCFRWNGPLHESLKNISYFGLEFSRDWSGVDSVIESMRNLFWPFLITFRTFCLVAFVTPYKVHQIPFQKFFEQKRAPEGCSFCECV